MRKTTGMSNKWSLFPKVRETQQRDRACEDSLLLLPSCFYPASSAVFTRSLEGSEASVCPIHFYTKLDRCLIEEAMVIVAPPVGGFSLKMGL